MPEHMKICRFWSIKPLPNNVDRIFGSVGAQPLKINYFL